jgi:uncharacterized protein YcfJ
MKHRRVAVVGLAMVGLLSGCAGTPQGPTTQVMPAPNKPFSAFEEDQAICKQYAQQQVQGQAEATNQRAVGGAVLGTALGAGLGAAIGGGQGAGIGAASGAVVGTGVGAGYSQNAQLSIQQQYNNAYAQCMYSKGNQVPGYQQPAAYAPPPPPMSAAPPTQGYDHALVRQIQSELARLGYLSGPADGDYGPKTRAAISEYQKSKGMPVDGQPTPALLASLRAS